MNCPQKLRKTRATSQIYPLIPFHWTSSLFFFNYEWRKNVLVCHKKARHEVPCEANFDLGDN